jgi:hypothetical protein
MAEGKRKKEKVKRKKCGVLGGTRNWYESNKSRKKENLSR